MSIRLFFYGTLCDLPLLQVVLGRAPDVVDATLPGHAAFWAAGQNFPVLRAVEDAEALGLLVEVSEAEIARFDFYEGPFGYSLEPVTIRVDGQSVEAQVYWPKAGVWQDGAPWSLTDWQRDWGPIVRLAAAEVMAAFGRQTADEVARRDGIIQARAQAQVHTAEWQRPQSIGSKLSADDVSVTAQNFDHLGFFTLEHFTMRHARFDGGTPMEVQRAILRAGEAVTVLPYDPVRDRVLLVEQFRSAPFVQGDPHPWLLEPVAGIVDAGETAEETAHREAMEEAGIAMGDLHFVARYYPTPGVLAQVLYSYVGIADLPDEAAGLAGLAGEGEDIAVHVVSYDQARDALESGEIAVAPLILTLQWLALHRERLRSSA